MSTMVSEEIENKEISKQICKNDTIHLNIMLHIRKSLEKKLSEVVLELMEKGFKQQFLAKILDVDQPKISTMKKMCSTQVFSIEKMMKYLRLLGVYTIIDTGQEYIVDTIKFYTGGNEGVLKTAMLEIQKVVDTHRVLQLQTSQLKKSAILKKVKGKVNEVKKNKASKFSDLLSKFSDLLQ